VFGFDSDMVFRIPALLIALTFHEYAHALVAVKLGDPTPRLLGRLSLNPVAHLDPIGLIMLWLFKFGWAKPVPINPSYFANSRKGMMLVSLAGPGANILLALLTALVIGLLMKLQLLTGVWSKVLYLTYSYNLVFAIFNLVPVPPLDGSKILSSLLPGPQAYAFERLEQYGPFILICLIYF
jgi:Zn-dependent protease